MENEGGKMELLNNTGVKLAGIKIWDHMGKRVNVKIRCEICAFADVIEEHDALKCTKTGLMTVDNGLCDEFNITKQMMDDIYHGCIK
jgi:hypothetical protein